MALWFAFEHCSVQGQLRYPGDHFEAEEEDLGVLPGLGLVKLAPPDWDPNPPEPDVPAAAEEPPPAQAESEPTPQSVLTDEPEEE